jgi:hypothetical protein
MSLNFFEKQSTRREMLRSSAGFARSALLAQLFPASLLSAGVPGLRQQASTPPTDSLAAMRAQMGSAPIQSQTLAENLTLLSGPGGNVMVFNGPEKVVHATGAQESRGLEPGQNSDRTIAAGGVGHGSRKPKSVTGLVRHSDRGVRYARAEYLRMLRNHGVIPSISRLGRPLDNGKCERFFRTSKQGASVILEFIQRLGGDLHVTA